MPHRNTTHRMTHRAVERMPMSPTVSKELGALLRWLSQIRKGETGGFNSIRRVEVTLSARRTDDPKHALRGIVVADGLVLTRQRMFYRLLDDECTAVPISFAKVASLYALETIRENYRAAQERWKAQRRRAS